jgi:hypothetical protein
LKLKDIRYALIACGCLNTTTDTDLKEINFDGFSTIAAEYNGLWNDAVHITMLSELFTTYYMEEDNLKTYIQQVKVDKVGDRLEGEISDVLGIATTAQTAANAASEAITAINDDNIFSVFEKRDFLNNTWYPIAGSYTYNSNAGQITYETYTDTDGSIKQKPSQNPSEGFLGTTKNGSFWTAVENIIGDNTDISVYNKELGELIDTFNALATFCVANGLFANELESTTFYTSREHNEENVGFVGRKELSDLLYNYYREEEECKNFETVKEGDKVFGGY